MAIEESVWILLPGFIFAPVRTVIVSVVGRLPVSRNLCPKRAFISVDLPSKIV